MSLAKLAARKRLVVVGLNSGTSADGLDLCGLAFNRDSGRLSIRFLAGDVVPYPRPLRKAVLDLCGSDTVSLDMLNRMNNRLGLFFGEQAKRFIRRLHRLGYDVHAVASHGQTVRHTPSAKSTAGQPVRGSLQIGLPEQIAATCRLPVIADFRQADIALGGEGAPITSSAMHRLFADKTESRLIVNIGGMSNFFFLPAGSPVTKIKASDCGPGNALSDDLCRLLFNRPYDRDGRIARKGSVSQPLLRWLLGQPFLQSTSQSTGREQFGVSLVRQIIGRGKKLRLSREDLLASAVEFTVQVIANNLRPLVRLDRKLSKLYLTGGGAQNSFMVSRLIAVCDWLNVGWIDDLGVPSDFVEAAAFAVMGEAARRAEAMPGTRFSGSLFPISGRIVQPPGKMLQS